MHKDIHMLAFVPNKWQTHCVPSYFGIKCWVCGEETGRMGWGKTCDPSYVVDIHRHKLSYDTFSDLDGYLKG